MEYLKLKDIEDINNYCKSKCKKVMNEHNKTTLIYHRGMYKGYMYGITITIHLTDNKAKITKVKLYKIFKDEKNKIQTQYIKNSDLKKGLIDSLYDLMNFTSSIN